MPLQTVANKDELKNKSYFTQQYKNNILALIKQCVVCHGNFAAHRKQQKLCSYKCRGIWANKHKTTNNRNGIIKKCVACKKDFYVPPYRIFISKFCSVNCLNKLQYTLIRQNFKCIECNRDCLENKTAKLSYWRQNAKD